MTTVHTSNGRRLPGAARARTFSEPAPYAPTVPAPPQPVSTTPEVTEAPAPASAIPTATGVVLHHDEVKQQRPAAPETHMAQPEPHSGPVTEPAAQSFDAPTAPAALIAPSTAVVTWEPAPLDETPATWGRKQAVIKALSFGLVKPKPGREEMAHRENERLIRSANWPRAARVVVANPKGGSGKTPASLVLGGAMGRVRGGSVAVWDAADAPGTLHVVAEGTARRCVAEIAADPEGYAYPGTIAAVATTQTTGADALVSLSDREFTGDKVARIQWALDRTYRVSIADTGNVAHSSAFQQLIATADILVVPTVIQQASVDSALRLLHRLQDSTDLVQRAVVAILHTGTPQTPGLATAIDRLFQDAGVEQPEHIPFDRHIAAGSTITYDRLSRSSQLAWTRLATATVANITTA